jgi:hypothetical protein
MRLWKTRMWGYALGLAFVFGPLPGALHAESAVGGQASLHSVPGDLRPKRLNGYLKVWEDGELSYYEQGTTFRPALMVEGSAYCSQTQRATVAYLNVVGTDQNGHRIAYGLMVVAAQCEFFAEAIVTRQVHRRTASTSVERRPSASVL